jgi:hypothetical protein
MRSSRRRHYGWHRGFRNNHPLLGQCIDELGEQIPNLYGPIIGITIRAETIRFDAACGAL